MDDIVTSSSCTLSFMKNDDYYLKSILESLRGLQLKEDAILLEERVLWLRKQQLDSATATMSVTTDITDITDTTLKNNDCGGDWNGDGDSITMHDKKIRQEDIIHKDNARRKEDEAMLSLKKIVDVSLFY